MSLTRDAPVYSRKLQQEQKLILSYEDASVLSAETSRYGGEPRILLRNDKQGGEEGEG